MVMLVRGVEAWRSEGKQRDGVVWRILGETLW